MRQKTLVISAVMLAFSAVGLLGRTYAQEMTKPQSAQDYQTQQEQLERETEQTISNMRSEGARSCQLSANYLRGLHRQAELTINYRIDTYQVILDQANELAIVREADNQSATELRVALAELSDRVTDFSTNYAQYRAELLEAANIACNEQSELRATVSRALSALRTAEFHSQRVAEYAQGEFSDLLTQMEKNNE